MMSRDTALAILALLTGTALVFGFTVVAGFLFLALVGTYIATLPSSDARAARRRNRR